MSLEVGQEWLLHTTPFKLKETTAPTAAEVPGNTLAFYAKDNGAGISTLCYKNDAGTEICLPTVGPLVTGSGVTNQVAIWGGTSALIGDTGLIFNPSTDALTVAGSLTSNSLTAGRIVFSGASGLLSDSSKFLYDSTNNVLTIGGGAGGLTGNRSIDLLGTGTEALASLIRQTANGVNNFSNFQGRMSRGTAGTPTATQADDVVTRLSLIQYGATGYAAGARATIDLVAGENATDTAHGTYIKLQTTSLLSTTLTERFRVGPAGQWGIGGATFGTTGDLFKSGGAAAAPTWTAPANVTAGSSKITLGGTPTAASLLAFSIDVAEANLTHNNLGGLTTGDPHTQYALLAGRSGGQTIIGGTAIADNLSLKATAGIGAGSEFITAQVGNNGSLTGWTVGQANSQAFLRVNGTSTRNDPLSVQNFSDAVNTIILTGDGANANILQRRYTDNTSGGIWTARKGRGTLAAPGQTLSGDRAIQVISQGHDASGNVSGNLAQFEAVFTENVTSTAGGSKWAFYTVPNTTLVPAVALTLDQNGDWVMGVATAKIDLSAISAGSPNLKITATSDTPATTWTAGVPSNNPAGYVEILDGANTRYIPFWT